MWTRGLPIVLDKTGLWSPQGPKSDKKTTRLSDLVDEVRKFLLMAEALLKDVAFHCRHGSDADVRIATNSLVWAIDLLIKAVIVTRGGDLRRKEKGDLYQDMNEMMKQMQHEAGSRSLDLLGDLPTSCREKLFLLLECREDAFHRGARMQIDESKSALKGVVPVVEKLYELVAEKDFDDLGIVDVFRFSEIPPEAQLAERALADAEMAMRVHDPMGAVQRSLATSAYVTASNEAAGRMPEKKSPFVSGAAIIPSPQMYQDAQFLLNETREYYVASGLPPIKTSPPKKKVHSNSTGT